MAVQVSKSATGRVAVVALLGEQDLGTAEELRHKLLELSTRVPLVVIDFAATTFLDSTIIGVLVAAWKRSARHGHQVLGVNAHATVLKALQLTGVDSLLQMPGAGELGDVLLGTPEDLAELFDSEHHNCP